METNLEDNIGTHFSDVAFAIAIALCERYQKPVVFGTLHICNDNNNNVVGMHPQVLMLLAG